jgi:hypothetical protein
MVEVGVADQQALGDGDERDRAAVEEHWQRDGGVHATRAQRPLLGAGLLDPSHLPVGRQRTPVRRLDVDDVGLAVDADDQVPGAVELPRPPDRVADLGGRGADHRSSGASPAASPDAFAVGGGSR